MVGIDGAPGVNKFVAKISQDNEPSIGLFRGLDFAEVSRSSVFREVTMELVIDARTSQQLAESAKHVQSPYDLSLGACATTL